MNRLISVTLLIICFVFISFSSSAHTRSQSFSQWYITDNATDNENGIKVKLSFNILSREITRLAADASVDVRKDLPQILIEHLNGKIKTSIDDTNCQIIKPLFTLPASKGYTRLEAEFKCLQGHQFQLTMQGFFDVIPSHLHYARVIRVSGEASEMVLSDAVRSQVIDLQNSNKNYWQTAKTYLNLGVEHILICSDHLVFLLALLLLCRRASHVFILITGFTVGHSITLSLAVFGWLQPNMATIEALIGFSIALVALEKIQTLQQSSIVNKLIMALGILFVVKAVFGIGLPLLSLVGISLFSISYLLLAQNMTVIARTINSDSEQINKTRAIQFLLTTAFGFIHGFGFADVLREIGLPPAQLGLALLSFNLGVEIGQIFALILMMVVIMLANKMLSKQMQKAAMSSVVAIILGLGCYWFFVRSFIF